MDIFNQRLASKKEYFQLFLVCALPVHIWAIITLMKWASTLILPLKVIQILGVVDYVLFFALLESLFVFSLLFILSLILPERLFSSRLVPAGTMIIFIASISAAFIHLYQVWEIEAIKFDLWTGFWVIFGMVAALLSIHWVNRDMKAETAIRYAVDRISVLSLVYLFFDFLGVFGVLIRNLF